MGASESLAAMATNITGQVPIEGTGNGLGLFRPYPVLCTSLSLKATEGRESSVLDTPSCVHTSQRLSRCPGRVTAGLLGTHLPLLPPGH